MLFVLFGACTGVASTLSWGIALDFLTAAISLYVGYRVFEAYRAGIKALGPSMAFWIGLAGFMLLDGGYSLLVIYNEPQGFVLTAVLLARRLFFIAGLAGLAVTLSRMAGLTFMPWWVGYYGILMVVVEAQTLYQAPIGHVMDVWSVRFVYARNTPFIVNFLEGVAMFLPLVILTGLVLSKYKIQPTNMHKFRLSIICLGVASMCVGLIVGFYDNDWYWYGVYENRVGLGAALGALFAVRPPFFMRIFWKAKVVKGPADWPIVHARDSIAK